MDETDATRCATCKQESAARFVYRTLNGAYPQEEPLCHGCAALLDGVPSVDFLAPIDAVGPAADESGAT
jgi:MinD superfamily P-loop ATPase